VRRRPGRPRKTDDVAEDTITVAAPKGLNEPNNAPGDEDVDDTSYQPTESEEIEEGDEDVEEDWETGALAWGLITVGGLGKGSAGIYGAEIIAR